MDDYEINKKVHIEILKEYLFKVSNTIDQFNKVNVIIDMFNYIITVPEFIAKEAKFRYQMELKIVELSKDVISMQLENKKKFLELAIILKKFLEDIKCRNDYVSIYDPLIHKIVITL